MNGKILSAAVAVLALALAGVGGALLWTCHRVRVFEKTHGADVYANLDRRELDALAKKAVAKAARKVDASDRQDAEEEEEQPEVRAEANRPDVPMRVEKVTYDNGNELRIVLASRPDMDVVRRFVTVEPLASGNLAFRYATPYSAARDEFDPVLHVTGDFAHRTNVTLRVKAGFPKYGTGANPHPKGALAQDFTYTFRRPDRAPSVSFADDGRYLPPAGRRTVGLSCVNVAKLRTEVRRVEPRNVVQLLAREERVYSRSSWRGTADEEETAELAGAPVVATNVCANVPNVTETVPVAADVPDGGSARGIFLVTAINADLPRCEWAWRGEKLNPLRCRLVCLSDLGLTVRDLGGDFGVWVTSLLQGTPVAGARVEVFSTANTCVMKGVTDARGWCRTTRVAAGDPFAVVVRSADGRDMTFLALRDRLKQDETFPTGARDAFPRASDLDAFVWTERGIYRHGERIFLQAIVRDGRRRAPTPVPVELRLLDGDRRVFGSVTRLTDARGTVTYEDFRVADDQPSGSWWLQAKIPGRNGRILGAREIRVEEFAPPQIRVRVAADEKTHPSNFTFRVTAEHLFGGPAALLRCEGAVVFEDVPFAPAAWKGWHFGDDDRGLKPCFRRLAADTLDKAGTHAFAAPIWADAGRPKAAVRATAQGTVFEDGGRPANARRSVVQHFYPYYIGSTLGGSLRLERGVRPRVDLVCLTPEARAFAPPAPLKATLERIDSVYAYRTRENGFTAWDCTRIRKTVAADLDVRVGDDGRAVLELPVTESGDYALTVRDPQTDVSYGRTFYLSDWCDETVRAPLGNPTAVTIVPDKAHYRVGERPHLLVKAPFAGAALMTVLREKEVYTEVLALTNATSVIALRPVAAADAPNLDVYLSVVQRVGAAARHFAARARGQTTVSVRPADEEIPVAVKARYDAASQTVFAEVDAPGAEQVCVTVVDEGINLLTDEPTPDPIARFGRLRQGVHPLYDLYGRLLPILDAAGPRVTGAKTGGGFGAEMLGKVSPVPTRRFKPLARWVAGLKPGASGLAQTSVKIPEFVGEVRVTAVAVSDGATGASSVPLKVSPKLVTMPDAPRFVAPGDTFEISMPVYNRSGAAGEIAVAWGAKDRPAETRFTLAKDASTNLVAQLVAPADPGEVTLVYRAEGFGEKHGQTILLPVRSAVAARETAGVVRERDWVAPTGGVWTARTFDSPLGELERALAWLADYPHGCLEQTCSRLFPCVAAGGILNGVVSNGADVVVAGVRRVESMVRSRDFVMWPDCDTAPWDSEVSLWAAHFLFAAEASGVNLNPEARKRVVAMVRRRAFDRDDGVSAYACLVLTLAGEPEKDRMLKLYDAVATLSLLARARLAGAFMRLHDRPRAAKLLEGAASPSSVKDAAFALLALLDAAPDDPRVLPLVKFLADRRDKVSHHWGTTAENAQALVALGAYYRRFPPERGERFVAWRKFAWPAASDVADEAHGLRIARRLLTAEGKPADLAHLRRGELLVSELALAVDDTRELSDLVVEDLFAGACEPVLGELPVSLPSPGTNALLAAAWVMRSDARDDRMLVFSKRFTLEKGREAVFRHPVRVVSAGTYTLPGPSVSAMYFPALRASRAPGSLVVEP